MKIGDKLQICWFRAFTVDEAAMNPDNHAVFTDIEFGVLKYFADVSDDRIVVEITHACYGLDQSDPDGIGVTSSDSAFPFELHLERIRGCYWSPRNMNRNTDDLGYIGVLI